MSPQGRPKGEYRSAKREGQPMKSTATRVAAWFALSLLGAATLGHHVAPALDKTLADLSQLCAPAPAEKVPLPRCGVA